MKARVANESLAEVMDRYTITGAPELCRPEGDRLRCLACGHRCLIGADLRGICKVRFNEAGQLKVPFGYVAGLQCDPVEKKPFFHVYPGEDALTFGMLGCDLHCSYCQNWLTSQALRDPEAAAPLRSITAGQLIEAARREKARLVVSSYNEPLITAEWAVSVFREAVAAGLACAFVSNGNATPEVLDFLRPWLVAYKVDLKSFSDRNYRTLGGTLDNITRTIRMVHERGLWLEVVTLLIPGFNSGDDELRQAADFLVSISPDIPWHVTAFHQDYRMMDPDPTSAEMLVRAAEIGTAAGLRFVYAGNLPGRVGPWENTRCPSCHATVIERFGYLIRAYRLQPGGQCPDCGNHVPGVWPGASTRVKIGQDEAAYRGRLPRRVAIGAAQDEHTMRSLPVLSLAPDRTPGGSPTMATAPPTPAARRELTATQKDQLAAAVIAMLEAATTGRPVAFPAELGELANVPVAGAFVSLKRAGHLRSCCGMFGRAVRLAEALERASDRSASEDERFPPVSASELNYLDVDIWLLHSPERIEVRGEQRSEMIQIGTHGVQVARGQAHGLFLPSVAVDSGWDARRLLDQVCLKAGLPASAWREEDTVLSRFEGEVIRTRRPTEALELPGVEAVPCRVEDLPTFVNLASSNLQALLGGATASPYCWGAPDGNVNGVVLFLQQPATNRTIHFSQLSLRPGVPLQATLYRLIQAAARQLASQGAGPNLVGSLQIGLAVLYEPMLHGTVADPHLAGLDPQRQALVVLERKRSAVLFDPERGTEELLAEAAAEAGVKRPAAAAVYSMRILTNAQPVRFSTVPRAVRGPAVRPPAVAGKFYEADPEALAREADRLLAGAVEKRAWPAALVPHAGWRFSGQIAADVLKRIRIPDRVLILGPKHTPHGVDWAVAPQQTWALPGMSVEADFMLARQLCQAIPGLEMDAAAHYQEHAIEVELPLLARLAPHAKVVGIAIGDGDLEDCQRFAEKLAGLLRERPEPPLLLISSDMNHFATDAENRRLDELALAALERCDPEALYQTVRQHHISMCGLLPAVIVLETLRLLGRLHRAERVGYATSADVTGDPSRVVGYAGMVFGSVQS